MAGPARLRVAVEGADLVVRFGGWDALWALRRTARVPLGQVRGARLARADEFGRLDWRGVARALRHPSWWRGLAVPGVIQAGSFRSAAGRELWDVRTGGDVLVVELAESAPYRRLVLEVSAPREILPALVSASRAAG
jgi:hypothetical protein